MVPVENPVSLPQQSRLHHPEVEQAADYFSVPPDVYVFEDERNSFDEDDIYRGEPPRPPSPPRSPRPESVASTSSSTSSSSSSSSNSSVFGGRLGAISGLVERAITHWARHWAASSSDSLSITSSSSSSTRRTIVTTSRSHLSRRRRRQSSLAEIRNAKSEYEVQARIRARAEARQVPREFVLYTPQSPDQVISGRSRRRQRDESGVLRTTSLPAIIGELSIALKDHQRIRRAQNAAMGWGTPSRDNQSRTPPDVAAEDPTIFVHDYMMPPIPPESQDDAPAAGAHRGRRRRKGKQKAMDGPLRAPSPIALTRTVSDKDLDKAWWLDVASPTWEDMRAIGKLLHLHPLTLEDILQRETREKLELFPKLGYYFVVFRAIESQKSRQRRLLRDLSVNPSLTESSIIAEVSVYLVVFREGIVSFHFEDIAEHTEVVRSKVLAFAESGTVTMSSDWIAHGIMDSIVDSFFPFLEEIETEIINIENLIFSDDHLRLHQATMTESPSDMSASKSDVAVSNNSTLVSEKEKASTPDLPEKLEKLGKLGPTDAQKGMQFAVPKRRRMPLRRIRHFIRRLSQFSSKMQVKRPQNLPTPNTVHRVAHVRRLVTSLSRFLATKSEVVAQVKKRILMTGEHGLGNGTGDDEDVFAYMGDVQDHILTLQQSLAHYERMLSQSHPTYLTQLRLSVSKAKAGSDKAILFLSVISMAVLCVQAVIGFFSMNVTLPNNLDSGKYNVFSVVLAISLVVLAAYMLLVRYWWLRARRRRNW